MLQYTKQSTDTAWEYIAALRKQHIITTHQNGKTAFDIDALVALRNFSSMTPIVGAFLYNVWYIRY